MKKGTRKVARIRSD